MAWIIRSGVTFAGSYSTVARFSEKLTWTSRTPSRRLRAVRMATGHVAQCMPSTMRLTDANVLELSLGIAGCSASVLQEGPRANVTPILMDATSLNSTARSRELIIISPEKRRRESGDHEEGRDEQGRDPDHDLARAAGAGRGACTGILVLS